MSSSYRPLSKDDNPPFSPTFPGDDARVVASNSDSSDDEAELNYHDSISVYPPTASIHTPAATTTSNSRPSTGNRLEGGRSTPEGMGIEEGEGGALPEVPRVTADVDGNERRNSGLEDVIAMVQEMRTEGFELGAGEGKRVLSGSDEKTVPMTVTRGEYFESLPTAPAISPPPTQQSYFEPLPPPATVSEEVYFMDGNGVPQLPPIQRETGSPNSLFEDFDGVHFAGPSPAPSPGLGPVGGVERRGPAITPPLHHPRPQSAGRSAHIPAPDPHAGMVFYPAPVPAVLNLPPLLSKTQHPQNKNHGNSVHLTASHRTTPYQGPNTAIVGSSSSIDLTIRRQSHIPGNLDPSRLSKLPAALRASAFFESQSAQREAQRSSFIPPPIQGSSAMATLDSILDASARAPPAAFTDHPITGLPAEQTGRSRRYETRHIHPGDSPDSSHSNTPLATPRPESPSLEFDPTAQPTTLLAELASRKAQQKSRSRTAGPTGIHSTLLQLDAVAEIQSANRRKTRTYLAWEDPARLEEHEAAGAEDEDVPLGMLFPDASIEPANDDDLSLPPQRDQNQPLGLLGMRTLDESEPLAKRAARLKKEKGRFTIDVPIPNVGDELSAEVATPDPDSDQEEETLAQRRARLQRENSSTPAGHRRINSIAREEDETLAQRRARLKLVEEARTVQQQVRAKRDSLIAKEMMRQEGQKEVIRGVNSGRPMTGMDMRRSSSMGLGAPGGGLRASTSMSHLAGMGGMMGGAGMMGQQQQFPQQFVPQQMGLIQQQQAYQAQHHAALLQQNQNMMMGAGMFQPPPQQQQQMMYGMGGGMGMQGGMGMGGMGQMGMGGMYGMGAGEQAMTSKQREFVERWRSGVM